MVLTRIDKSQLKIGMFVEAIEGAWQNHPSIGRRFTVSDCQQIEMIRNSNVSAILINTALGSSNTGKSESPNRSLKTIRNASKQDKFETARKIHGQAVEARSLLEGLFEGKDFSSHAFRSLTGDISNAMEENPSLYIGMSRLRSRDTATFVHSLSVAALLLNFARSLDMDEATVHHLCMAGLLHDLGKLTIPKSILQKQAPLTAAERALVERHPENGYQLLLEHHAMPQLVLDICRSHHERLDGKGYPDRLTADRISPEVRMSTICDVFDALTSTRPYKKGWSSQQALSWMMDREGQFDKSLLWRFVLSLDPEMTKGII